MSFAFLKLIRQLRNELLPEEYKSLKVMVYYFLPVFRGVGEYIFPDLFDLTVCSRQCVVCLLLFYLIQQPVPESVWCASCCSV